MPRQVDSPKPSLRTPPRSSDSPASVAFIIDMPGAMQPDGHLRCAGSARQRSRMNTENGQALQAPRDLPSSSSGSGEAWERRDLPSDGGLAYHALRCGPRKLEEGGSGCS
jgi:hypothetical protein